MRTVREVLLSLVVFLLGFRTVDGQQAAEKTPELEIYDVGDLTGERLHEPLPFFSVGRNELSWSYSLRELDEERNAWMEGECLVDVVKSGVRPDAWSHPEFGESKTNRLEYFDQRLIVRAPPDVQAEIARFLAALRREASLRVSVEVLLLELPAGFVWNPNEPATDLPGEPSRAQVGTLLAQVAGNARARILGRLNVTTWPELRGHALQGRFVPYVPDFDIACCGYTFPDMRYETLFLGSAVDVLPSISPDRTHVRMRLQLITSEPEESGPLLEAATLNLAAGPPGGEAIPKPTPASPFPAGRADIAPYRVTVELPRVSARVWQLEPNVKVDGYLFLGDSGAGSQKGNASGARPLSVLIHTKLVQTP